MDRETLTDLKMLTGSPEWKFIETYVAWRKSKAFVDLLQATSFEQVSTIQGEVRELDRLLSLRDRILDEEKKVLSRGK